jgi:shikimate 5-dehydrogenase
MVTVDPVTMQKRFDPDTDLTLIDPSPEKHMIKTISYLGLGTMGSGMASNLLKAGYELTVWNRNAEKCEPFARKGRA